MKYTLAYSLLMVAASALSVTAQDSSAARIIERFSAKMQESVAAEMHFTFSGADGRGVEIRPLEGVIYQQGADYAMLTPQVEVYTGGETKWIYTVDNNEAIIMRNEPTSVDLVENPLALFSSRLTTEYAISDKPHFFVEKGQEFAEITLTPMGKNVSYSSILLRINSQTLSPHSVKYHAKDGSWFEAVINSYTPAKQPFSPERFVFSAKERPGVFVTDLR